MDNLKTAQKILDKKRAEVKARRQFPSPVLNDSHLGLSDRYILSLRECDDTRNIKGEYFPCETATGRPDRWKAFNDEVHPKLPKALKQIKTWYNRSLDGNGGGLIISGSYGCGKTHLARAIYEHYGLGAYFLNEAGFTEAIFDKSIGQARVVKEAERAKLLVYDDLGVFVTKNMEWLRSLYYGLFDKRCDENRPFLLTTNLDATELNGQMSELRRWLGGRVYSRVWGASELVDLFGVPDFRLKS